MTLNQLSILNMIHSELAGICNAPSEAATALAMSRQGFCQGADCLARQGLLAKASDPFIRRAEYAITEEGRKTLAISFRRIKGELARFRKDRKK